MARAARRGDLCAGNETCAARPAREGSPDVTFNDQGALREGDALVPHKCAVHGPGAGKSAGGSATVFVNDRPVTRVGDDVDCGGQITTGSADVDCDSTEE